MYEVIIIKSETVKIKDRRSFYLKNDHAKWNLRHLKCIHKYTFILLHCSYSYVSNTEWLHPHEKVVFSQEIWKCSKSDFNFASFVHNNIFTCYPGTNVGLISHKVLCKNLITQTTYLNQHWDLVWTLSVRDTANQNQLTCSPTPQRQTGLRAREPDDKQRERVVDQF